MLSFRPDLKRNVWKNLNVLKDETPIYVANKFRVFFTMMFRAFSPWEEADSHTVSPRVYLSSAGQSRKVLSLQVTSAPDTFP